jgi:isopentenyl-diphosphate delta-isomerase type 1
MSEEYFDVVNERDEVIGRERRAEVHRRGLRHRAVHVLVFNVRGQVFLQKRSRIKDTYPGVWDSSASGHVESGEDYDMCVGRELREEIGLVPEVTPRRLFKVAACDETGQEFVWVYRSEADGPLELNPDEIEDGGWYSVEEVTRWMRDRPEDFASALRHIWRQMVKDGFL